MTAFADSFFYIALVNHRDAFHARAKKFAKEFRGEIVTTQWVLIEVADAFSDSAYRTKVQDHFRLLGEDTATRIIPVAPEQFTRGLKLYAARPDKAWSLTDCISFNVMRDEGLTQALTHDHHFQQAGFTAIFVD